MVTLGRHVPDLARLLIEHGADPTLRATLHKQLRDMGDPAKEQPRTYEQVTPAEYARSYAEPAWVNEPALVLVPGQAGRQ